MAVIDAGRVGRLTLKKSIAQIQAEAAGSHLKRSLGAFNLVSLGVGAIIGAGIFVLTGQVASANAGPAIMLSFVVAGVACALAGLCYAELSAAMPVSGSAYHLRVRHAGRGVRLDHGLAAGAGVWGGGLHRRGRAGRVIPSRCCVTSGSTSRRSWWGGKQAAAFATPLIQALPNAAGGTSFQLTGTLNLLAAVGILAVTALLIAGVSESAKVNNVIVVIKVCVLLAFVAIGVSHIHPANWHPFLPKNEGGFGNFGWSGVLRGSSIIFFAYVGFEAVSTAAAEANNPSRDIPIGIIGSLLICTVIYMVVAAVMTGVVPYRQLGGAEPIAVAIDRMNPVWAIVPYPANAAHQINLVSLAVKIGAFTGLSSVMLVLTYAQTRIFYTMARDGLLPKVFATLHPKLLTPWVGTLLLGVFIAISAAFLPIDLLGDLVSLGTALAFSIVCLSVIYLRRPPSRHAPSLPRARRQRHCGPRHRLVSRPGPASTCGR